MLKELHIILGSWKLATPLDVLMHMGYVLSCYVLLLIHGDVEWLQLCSYLAMSSQWTYAIVSKSRQSDVEYMAMPNRSNLNRRKITCRILLIQIPTHEMLQAMQAKRI